MKRLAVRIYLIGLAQMVVCIVGFIAIHQLYRGGMMVPPPPHGLGLQVLVFVLVVVAVCSWILTRSLTRPLRTLSRTAREFGSGRLDARARLAQQDELGDVSRAFDEMADQVTSLLRSERELLANVSHELRTPLARIRMGLGVATEGDPEIARASLAGIAEDLDELERLIADILTTARFDLADASAAGIPPLRRERVPVAELLARAVSRFRAAHPARTLHVDSAAPEASVDGDPVLLRRALDNLLDNADQYSERAGDAVELVVRATDGLVIDVIDHGAGIAPEDLARIFQPFFRADRSRTRATGGLGLGLALTKRIVDAHGGTLELTSTPSEGTRARMSLPTA